MPGKPQRHHTGAMDGAKGAHDQSDAREAAPLAAELMKLWPGDELHAVLRRGLVTTLLEDPDQRLRLSHLEALLQPLLKGAPSSSQLQCALADPQWSHLFAQEWAGKGDTRCRIVRLHVSELQHVLKHGPGAAGQHMAAQHKAPSSTTHAKLAAAAPAALHVPGQQQDSSAADAVAGRLQGSTPHMPTLGASTPGATAAGLGTPDSRMHWAQGQDATAAGHISRYGAASKAAAVGRDALGPAEDGLSRRIHATWPNAEADADEYLARAIAYLLAAAHSLNGASPSNSMHLTELGSSLAHSEDARLASIYTKGIGAAASKRGGKRPRLSEFVAQPRFRCYFSVQDSTVHKGEKVLVLLVDALATVQHAATPNSNKQLAIVQQSSAPAGAFQPAAATALQQAFWDHASGGGVLLDGMAHSNGHSKAALSSAQHDQAQLCSADMPSSDDTSELLTSPCAEEPASVVGFDVGRAHGMLTDVSPGTSSESPAVPMHGSSFGRGYQSSGTANMGSNGTTMARMGGAPGSRGAYCSGVLPSASFFGDGAGHVPSAPVGMHRAAPHNQDEVQGFSPLASGFGLAEVLGTSSGSVAVERRRSNSGVYGSFCLQPVAQGTLFQHSANAMEHLLGSWGGHQDIAPNSSQLLSLSAVDSAHGSMTHVGTPLQAALAAASAPPHASASTLPGDIASCWNGGFAGTLFGQAVGEYARQGGVVQPVGQRTPRHSSGSDVPFFIDGAGTAEALDGTEGHAAALLAEAVLLETDRDSDFQIASSCGSERSSTFIPSGSFKPMQHQQPAQQQLPAPCFDEYEAPALGIIGQRLPAAPGMGPAAPPLRPAATATESQPRVPQQQQPHSQLSLPMQQQPTSVHQPQQQPVAVGVDTDMDMAAIAAAALATSPDTSMGSADGVPLPPPPPPPPAAAAPSMPAAPATEHCAPAAAVTDAAEVPPSPPPPQPTSEHNATPSTATETTATTEAADTAALRDAAVAGAAAAAALAEATAVVSDAAAVLPAARPVPIMTAPTPPPPAAAAAAAELDLPLSGTPPRLIGWASIAARDPKPGTLIAAPGTRSAPAPKLPGTVAIPLNGKRAGTFSSPLTRIPSSTPADPAKVLSKLPVRVKAEVESIVEHFEGILKVEDFDEGVVAQLNQKRTEDIAIAAVRHIANYDIASIQHMAAYINHIIKHYSGISDPGSAPSGGASSIGVYGGQIRLASVPVSAKSMLAKLPLKVYRRLEQVVGQCSYLEWSHFDAGVVKVLAQLSQLAEDDVYEELDLLATTDLSNVQYIPAWLNKRLNNRLWSRRKAEQG